MEYQVARKIPRATAKRANRPNPREERNLPEFITGSASEPFRGKRKYRRTDDENQNTEDNRRSNKVDLLPRNVAQERYIATLRDITKDIIFAMGPAGTGKTMLATKFAIGELQKGNCSKIVITRPAVSVDEQHGFLPGTLTEKLAPWVVPIMDVVKEHYSVQYVEKMLEGEIIEISPLAYMRGRTFKKAIVIADEMQNATPSQMKMLLTRIGDDSRMIVTGDLRQHDRGFEANGLKDFVERLNFAGSSRIAVCEFDSMDIERHPVIEDVLRIYGED